MTAVPPLEPHRAARWEQDDAPEALRERVLEAARVAVANMAADWYCPYDSQVQRITCPDCIAEVAADAALAVITTPVSGAPEIRVTFDGAEAAPNPTAHLWSKRNTPSGHLRPLRRRRPGATTTATSPATT